MPKKEENSHSKKKITRVSRFVAHIRSSSKHGESLVVQTGFPTSLIDLIVKNRDRLNKSSSSSKRKKTKINNTQNQIVSCSQIQEDAPIFPTPVAPFILNAINNLLGEEDSDESSKQSFDSGKENLNLNDGKIKEEENEDRCVDFLVDVSGSIIFYMIFIMVSVVLVLALATKKLVIGITLSAFALVFLEFCCKYLISLLKSCINGCKGLMVSIHLEKGGKLIGVEESVVNNFVGFREEFDNLIKEKRIKEIDSELGKRDRLCELLDCERKREIEEDGEDNVVENVELGRPRRTRSARLGAAQFKKFMVKKFGAESKKKRKCKERELDSNTLENNSVVEGDIGEEEDNEDNADDDEQEVKKVDQCDSNDVSEVQRDMGFQEDLGRNVIWSSRNLIPVLVILAGLVCGRILALGLTVAWLILRNLHKVVQIYLQR